MSNPAVSTKNLALVGAGGAAGASARFLIPGSGGGEVEVPVGILIINFLACLFLGFLLTGRPTSTPTSTASGDADSSGQESRSNELSEASLLSLWSFAAVGFCGGLSTFSTLALDIAELIDGSRSGAAAATVVSAVVTGLGGIALGRRLAPLQLGER